VPHQRMRRILQLIILFPVYVVVVVYCFHCVLSGGDMLSC